MTRIHRLGVVVGTLALAASGALMTALPASAEPTGPAVIEAVSVDPIIVDHDVPFDLPATWKVTSGTAEVSFNTHYESPEPWVRANEMSPELTVTSADGTVQTVPFSCSIRSAWGYTGIYCIASRSVTIAAGDVISASHNLTFGLDSGERTHELTTYLIAADTHGTEVDTRQVAATVTVHFDSLPVPAIDPIVGGVTVLGLLILGGGAFVLLRRHRSAAAAS